MIGMTPAERRATTSLAGLFALRMLGLFMIIPVFALYSHNLTGSTPFLIGLAIGMYGLTQAIFQIPLGLLADHMNRKRLIFQGLILFAAGGAVAALSTSIWGVILGRAIQGSGAISAIVMALLADLTREENRTKAMASIGMSIGLSFAVAFVIGPLLAAHFGLSGLFWATSLLALTGMFLLARVPQPAVVIRQNRGSWWIQFRECLDHPELLRLNAGIFILHLVMTAGFVLMPHLLLDYAHLPVSRHGWVYLPVVLGGFILAVPFIIIAEKKRQMKFIFSAGVTLLALSLCVIGETYRQVTGLIGGLALFFIAFNLLEALLPSLLSKIAPAGSKATAMGIYSSSQFLGAFCGGILGGILVTRLQVEVIYDVLAAITLIWLALAMTMRPPRHLHSLMMSVDKSVATDPAHVAQQLQLIPGIEEAVVLAEEGVVYLKVDRSSLDEKQLKDFIPRLVAV